MSARDDYPVKYGDVPYDKMCDEIDRLREAIRSIGTTAMRTVRATDRAQQAWADRQDAE